MLSSITCLLSDGDNAASIAAVANVDATSPAVNARLLSDSFLANELDNDEEEEDDGATDASNPPVEFNKC